MLLDTGKNSKEANYAEFYEKLPAFVKDMVPPNQKQKHYYRLDIGGFKTLKTSLRTLGKSGSTVTVILATHAAKDGDFLELNNKKFTIKDVFDNVYNEKLKILNIFLWCCAALKIKKQIQYGKP